MSDFIREVDEDYRRERILGVLARYQILIAIVVVGVVVGAGGWRIWHDQKIAAAEADNARYAAADTLAKDGKSEEARAAFESLVKSGPAGYAALSRLRAAALLGASDPEGGARAFDDIANDDSIGPAIRDEARLRGAILRIDILLPVSFEQRYGRFGVGGFAYHASMRELLALAAMKRGDTKAATDYLDQILVDPVAPPQMRNRVAAYRALIAGGPATPMTGKPPPAHVAPVTSGAVDAQPATPVVSPPMVAPAPATTSVVPAPPVSPPVAAVPPPAVSAPPAIPPKAAAPPKPATPPASGPD